MAGIFDPQDVMRQLVASGLLGNTFNERWGDTPDTFAGRWGDMPSASLSRNQGTQDPAKAMRQMEANQRVSNVGSHMAQGLLDYYQTPGDVLAGKYTPQPATPGVLSEQDVEASNRGADQMMRRGPQMALETLGIASPFAQQGALGAMGGKLVQPQGILGAGSGERIVGAAVRAEDGRIFSGQLHSSAAAAAQDAKAALSKNPKDSDGWVTSTGRFVDREEAAKIANAAAQTKESTRSLESSLMHPDYANVGQLQVLTREEMLKARPDVRHADAPFYVVSKSGELAGYPSMEAAHASIKARTGESVRGLLQQ